MGDEDLHGEAEELRAQVAALQARIERSERDTRRERVFSAEVLEVIAALVVVMDCDGVIVRFNRACEVATGFSREEILGRRIWDVLIVPGESDGVQRVFDRLAAGMFPSEYENYWRKKDGGRCLIAWSNTAILDEEGEVEFVVGTGLDITEQRRAEAERKALEARVLQAQKLESLGVLAGGIAHDFNNLLVGILGNADLALLELAPEAPARRSVHAIELTARRAAELVRQMLAYSGKGSFQVERIDLRAIVEEMTHLLEVSISKGVVIKYEFGAGVPTVDADATQIRQVVMNLITNASEAIGEQSGVIRVRTGVMPCDEACLQETWLDQDLPEGLYSYIEVSDTGCGIDPESLERVFEPFFTTKFTGRGLGLAAVLGIVRNHRGALKVVSKPGKGTTFTVLLPATGAVGASPDREPNGDEGWRGRGTALFVDDEETVRTVGRSMLRRMGFEVVTARDGLEAIERFRADPERFAVVVLDLTMPQMSGDQCLSALRRLRPDAKILVSSGYSESDLERRFAAKRVDGYLQKPYQFSVLRDRIKRVLDGE